MKTVYIYWLCVLFGIPVSAQTLSKYYLLPKQESILELNPSKDGLLSFKNTAFNNLFSGVVIKKVEAAFPDIKNDYLKKLHILTVENDADLLWRLLKNPWLEHAEQIEEAQLMSSYPNDYRLPYSFTNHYLDLVRAPFAWSITKGNPDILVGVADSYFTFKHEELKNKIVRDLNIGQVYQSYYSHGTEVAGIIAGETNNRLGTASLGYNTKLMVYSDGVHLQAVERLSREPGVRVINMSWSDGFKSLFEESLCNYIRDSLNIVLVGSAGNGYNGNNCRGIDSNGYCYPASYESVIGVTGTGSRFPRGTNDAHWGRYNWEDVAELYIGNSQSTMTVNDKVDISAPGYDLLRATNTLGTIGSVDTYADHGSGTSTSAPLVSATAALMFAANPNLTAKQVKEILMETADNIYDIPENAPYRRRLGAGRLNAYRAVLKAKCLAEPSNTLDLMIQDSQDDYGVEPNTTTEHFWESSGIWVRNQRDGKNIRINENPEYDANGYSYVYVKVVNKSCVRSSGNDKLQLYWSKASSNSTWPQNWNGSFYHEGALMGNQVGLLTIPVLEPGEDVILEFPWRVPNPELYPNVNENGRRFPWHFCLLARIDSQADPMTYEERPYLTFNVQYNNNIVWKNISVVNLLPNSPESTRGATIAVGNSFRKTDQISLDFEVVQESIRTSNIDEMEIQVIMDDVLFQAWIDGGKQSKYLKLLGDKKFLVLNNQASLGRLLFKNEKPVGLLTLLFNHKLEEAIAAENPFRYRVIQRDFITKEIMGGETYEIKKPISFKPNNLINETTVENAVSINKIVAIAPNPTTGNVLIGYEASSCSQLILALAPLYGVNGNSFQISLNSEENQLSYDVSNYLPGLYKVMLYCDGTVVDTKSLLIE
ncbi:S8/S53 family peptidase [Flavobacterium sp. NKUCC04_CG]|uniref:S8 family peptidase n=1 Tax=Flavobacterium sp. NKUCC04_CG TaxID=2842121 RepID=UPI001C5BD690|nr:S8/S53 family peptidase [Flavobacterium sp. NKUCC04_CG]MBW3520328.1 S8/S53 family peptidase [Flavobacterium sp. NKUCC04_CG]